MKRFLIPVMASAAVAACAGPVDGQPPAAPSTTAIRDCGSITVTLNERPPAEPARCLVEAVRAGLPARLKVTEPDVEGHPVPITYTAGAGGQVEMVTDYRKVGFATPQILRQICTEPTLEERGLRFARCSEPTPVPG